MPVNPTSKNAEEDEEEDELGFGIERLVSSFSLSYLRKRAVISFIYFLIWALYINGCMCFPPIPNTLGPSEGVLLL